ncbi:MAG: magnesium transporter [Desulfobacteraceae bacterium]|jgi:magnesium transporter
MGSTEYILTEEIVDEVKRLIAERDRITLAERIDELRPADVADLIELLDPEERFFVFDLLEPDGAGEVLVEIEAPFQERILSDLDNEAISEIVQELDSDDAADLVGDLPLERAREIIGSLQDDVSRELEKLLPYPEDTAGGIMALEFVAVLASATVQETIDTLREKREEVEDVYYVFVVDEVGRLAGVVSLKDLVLAQPTARVAEIMNEEVIFVHVDRDQEEVAQLFKKYDLVSIPVVDDSNRLVGRITHDDIIDVIEDEVDEDIARMAGVISAEIADESTVRISRSRLPWLVAGLLGGILAALVINQFEASLEEVLALSFFFPVIMAMGGNTGTQASTVAVRGLATGDIRMVNIGKRLWLEMKVAFFNGIICGILLGLIVGAWLSNFTLGGIVALALVLIIVISGFIGAAIPIALKRMRVDPALATGPFVTTSNDLLSLVIYLGLVTVYLQVTG